MARSADQIMKDIEAVKKTPAFQKKMAAFKKEKEKQAAAAKAKEVKAKPKPTKVSGASRAPSKKPRRIAGGAGMRGGAGGFGGGSGLRGNVNK